MTKDSVYPIYPSWLEEQRGAIDATGLIQIRTPTEFAVAVKLKK